MEMDCDFSHDPADLARLLDAVKGGADLALGSRYVPGGGVQDWGLLRRVISEGGSTYARSVLGLRVKDLTGGFKCFRREVLEAIHFDGVRSQGYAFQVELTYRAVQAGFRVVEVPIVFRDREQGTSKMSWRIAAEAMWLVPLRLRSAQRLALGHAEPGRRQRSSRSGRSSSAYDGWWTPRAYAFAHGVRHPRATLRAWQRAPAGPRALDARLRARRHRSAAGGPGRRLARPRL